MPISFAYNMDCLEAMRKMPDGAFDLAVVDPPYGSCSNSVHVERERRDCAEEGSTEARTERGFTVEVGLRSISTATIHATGGRFARYETTPKQIGGIFDPAKCVDWDIAPPPEYFEQLARVSKNQIIWGGNYFDLPPTRCFLIWEKLTISEGFSMAMCEYAWTSFNENAKLFKAAPQGTAGEKRFHPTQKPVSLYAWIFRRYAKPGDKILDTHLGSGSSRIAAYDAGLDFTGYEINKTYFDKQEERFAAHTSQLSLFT